ncbi:MAG: hypothetical protein ACP5NL_00085 [Thermoplasmata archaeon]
MKLATKNFLIIIIIFLVLGLFFSGMFAVHNGNICFYYTTNQKPYLPGSYENYSLNEFAVLGDMSYNFKGYINVSSGISSTTVDVNVWISVLAKPSYYFHDVKTLIFIEKNGYFYYNGSRVILPFFYEGNTVISEFRGNYNNGSNDGGSIITDPGIYQFHPGIFLSTSFEEYEYSADSKQLFIMSSFVDSDPLFMEVFGIAYKADNNTYPVPLHIILNKTNYIVFPPDWLYIITTFSVVFIIMGAPIIVPVLIILILIAYRKHKRRKYERNEP